MIDTKIKMACTCSGSITYACIWIVFMYACTNHCSCAFLYPWLLGCCGLCLCFHVSVLCCDYVFDVANIFSMYFFLFSYKLLHFILTRFLNIFVFRSKNIFRFSILRYNFFLFLWFWNINLFISRIFCENIKNLELN